MTATALQVDADGRVVDPSGQLKITYAEPWPVPNGYATGFEHPALGVVQHTEDGYESGVESEFANPAAQVSAFFSIGGAFKPDPLPAGYPVSIDGALHQYGPVGPGHGWTAWAQVAGNATYYSIENEDGGDPSRPMTAAQIETFARVYELLSRLDDFPIQEANAPGEKGLIGHCQGGAAWGNHACPCPVRLAQRSAILAAAEAIRNPPKPPAPKPAPAPTVPHEADVAAAKDGLVRIDHAQAVEAQKVGLDWWVWHKGDSKFVASRAAEIPTDEVLFGNKANLDAHGIRHAGA